jgi:hypothetical protein
MGIIFPAGENKNQALIVKRRRPQMMICGRRLFGGMSANGEQHPYIILAICLFGKMVVLLHELLITTKWKTTIACIVIRETIGSCTVIRKQKQFTILLVFSAENFFGAATALLTKWYRLRVPASKTL